jgi:hypothetical protein
MGYLANLDQLALFVRIPVLRPGPAIHAQKRTKTHNLGATKSGYSISEYGILIL